MKRKDCMFIIMAMLLALLILFCTTETVMSQGRGAAGMQQKYYAGIEEEYLSNLNKALSEKGYQCSGITMRWVADSEGLRSYTVMIHHRKINSLDAYEKEELLHELSAAEFEDERCTFNYELITT